MRSITCTNDNGYSTTFREDGFAPFFLIDADGLYESKNKIYSTDNAQIDGATYQGSVAEKRNIVLTVIASPYDNDWKYAQSKRDYLYTLFRRGEKGTLYYRENGKSRKIEYYVEGVSQSTSKSRPFVISLLCPNPFFDDAEESTVSMANWIPTFEFPHYFGEPESLGEQSQVRLVQIENNSAVRGIGLTITITTTGQAVNPSVTLVEQDASIEVGTQANPFTMERGDVLVITTGLNNKHVRLTHNGVTQEVNEYLSEESEFIQLGVGMNNIVYSAYEGEEYLSVSINYHFSYEGA